MSRYAFPIPFGKYRGQYLPAVPKDYLLFLLSQPWLKPFMRSAIVDELMHREGVARTKALDKLIAPTLKK